MTDDRGLRHLNDIQRLCTNLEGDSELVVGSVYGLRQWRIERKLSVGGRAELFGHYGRPWNLTGTNTATCEKAHGLTHARGVWFGPDDPGQIMWYMLRSVQELFDSAPGALDSVSVTVNDVTGPEMTFYADGSHDPVPWDFRWRGGRFMIDGVETSGVSITLKGRVSPGARHRPADPSCTCGYYAYTDEESLLVNSSTHSGSVFGIIRAWGNVTQGPKGFRAEHAEIVGLTPVMSQVTVHRYELDGVEIDADAFWSPTGSLPTPSGALVRSVGLTRTWSPLGVTDAYRSLVPPTLPRYADMKDLITRYTRLTDPEKTQ